MTQVKQDRQENLSPEDFIIISHQFSRDSVAKKYNEDAAYHLAAIVSSCEDAIISKTLTSDITSWNVAAERLFGYSAEEVIGKNIRFIIPSYLQDEEDVIVQKIKQGERIEHYQTERVKKDGNVIPVSLTISPIYNDKGEIIGISNITRDITLQKQYDQEKSDFLSMVSHELKTPLTSMKMFLELLKKHVEPTNLDEAKYIVSRIQDQTSQLVELTNDLLDVSRIQTGKLRLKKEKFRLHALVQETVEALATSTRTHKLIILSKIDIEIIADRYRVFQVLVNFLTNAIKYSPAGKDIHISLKKKDDEAIISVQDFGIGIKKEQRKKIFERHYQVSDQQAKTYPGLGLGLYISKEIIERHNGRIWVESVKGKGSTFYFSLPLGRSNT